jgi:hypothetical protein
VCSGRHSKIADGKTGQSHTEPSQLVSATEAGGRMYQTTRPSSESARDGRRRR